MSPQTPSSDNAGRKQPLNVYTVMLLISFIALTIGSILMFLELQRYGSWPQWRVSQADRPAIEVVETVPAYQTYLG